ncbi:Os09g0341901, partial [Oryza sativa Japonica Group]
GLNASSVSILRFIYVWNCILLVVLCTLAGPGQGFNTQNSLEIWVKFLGVTRYYKERILADGRQLVFQEVYHEECAKQINGKYHTNFTSRQVYHMFHKLKAQWKVIMEAKNLSGPCNFDDVEKKILYDETEVVRMTNVNKMAKFINVPIRWYDEMEFIF